MPSRSRALPRRRLLSAALAVAAGSLAPVPVPAATPAHRDAGADSCPLGSFTCPRRPVSYAMCRPNDLLAFYQPGLPADTLGRASTPVQMDADHASSQGRQHYHLRGHVRLQRYDQLLRADRIDYAPDSTAYLAQGHVRYQESGLLLSADRMQGTTVPEHGRAEHVRYQLLTSRGNGRARSMLVLDKQRSRMHQATYSTCDPDDPVWQFRGSRIDLNRAKGFGVAHSATMRFEGVPFLYLPYFTFPIDNQRRSGFLYPMFGYSNSSGFMFSIPYYLNLAPNYDAMLTPRLYTGRGLMLGTQFRYLTTSSKGQIDLQYLPHDRDAHTDGSGVARPDLANGADRYYLDARDSTRLSPSWSFITRIRNVSDPYYFRDFRSQDISAWSSVLASDAYLVGGGRWWNASFGFDRYQNVDPRLTTAGMQYRRWPRATFGMDLPVAGNLEFNLDSSAVAFRKSGAVQGNRVDIYPNFTLPMAGAAWYLRPQLGYRYTAYRLLDGYQNYGFSKRAPSTGLPIASIDSGLIFDRNVKLFGNHYTQTLEPRLYYLYVPYRDQSDQPIFDSRLMTFDYWQLFSSNRFSGADRQMNANNLTMAVTSRLLDDGGVERASLSFGEIRYFAPQKVQLYGMATDYAGSAYVSELGVQLSPKWRLQASYQWDPNIDHTSVGTFTVQRRLGSDGIFNFAYRFRSHFLEQFDVSAVYPVSPRWRLVGRWNISLRDQNNWQRGHPKTLEAIAGVEYDSCCVAVRLVGHHFVRDYQGHTDNAVMLEIEFKGLGSFAPQTEALLRRAILGYQ